jgi:hypothetical protein
VAFAIAVDSNATALGAWDAATGVDTGTVAEAGNMLDYMPDVWNGDDPPTYSPATEVTDRVLLSGQAPRVFV